MVKMLPSNAGGTGSIPGWGSKIPHAWWPKRQNIKQKQYCKKQENTIKTLKMVHIKKKNLKKINKSLKCILPHAGSCDCFEFVSPEPVLSVASAHDLHLPLSPVIFRSAVLTVPS